MTEWDEQFGGFVEQVRGNLVTALLGARRRFPSVDVLVRRFDQAAETLLTEGPDCLNGFEEVHNELCVAALTLEASRTACSRLEYEPAMARCSQRFDFSASFEGRSTAWIEVKTIHPDPVASWEQYERLAREGRFQRMRVCISRSNGWVAVQGLRKRLALANPRRCLHFEFCILHYCVM